MTRAAPRTALCLVLLAILVAGCPTQGAGPTATATQPRPSGSTTSSASPSGSRSTEATPTAEDSVLAFAVGDLANDGDRDEAVAAMIQAEAPEAFLALGDLVYPHGSMANYQSFYTPGYGRFNDIVWPTPGNHDYRDNAIADYFAYFAANAPQFPGEPYYAFQLGAWRFYSLNSEIGEGGAGSDMYTWLEAQLRDNPAQCIGAMWHSPIYTIGRKPYDEDGMRPIYDLLLANGVDLVLTGHDHNYQRWNVDDTAYFVVGTGGRSRYAFESQDPKVAFSDDQDNGALELRLRPDGADFRFHAVRDTTPIGVTDSGSFGC